MDKEHMQAAVRMTDGRAKYEGRVGSFPPVTLDAHPPYGGAEGYTPMELLLISLMSCTSMATTSLLRERMRRQVLAVQATADGTLREENPQSFERIEVHLVFTSPDATEAEVQRALTSAEKKVCPVWAMLKGNVEIVATFEIKR